MGKYGIKKSDYKTLMFVLCFLDYIMDKKNVHGMYLFRKGNLI